MQDHAYPVWASCNLCLIQNVEVFHADIVFFIEETLLLNTGHVKKVKLRKCILKTNDFLELLVIAYEHVVTDVVRETELIRRDQNKFDVRITDQCLDQGVNSTAEFQVAAKTDREIVKASLFRSGLSSDRSASGSDADGRRLRH